MLPGLHSQQGPLCTVGERLPVSSLDLLWLWSRAVLVMSARDCDITDWRWSEKGPLQGNQPPGLDKMEDPKKNRAGNSPEVRIGGEAGP